MYLTLEPLCYIPATGCMMQVQVCLLHVNTFVNLETACVDTTS